MLRKVTGCATVADPCYMARSNCDESLLWERFRHNRRLRMTRTCREGRSATLAAAPFPTPSAAVATTLRWRLGGDFFTEEEKGYAGKGRMAPEPAPIADNRKAIARYETCSLVFAKNLCASLSRRLRFRVIFLFSTRRFHTLSSTSSPALFFLLNFLKQYRYQKFPRWCWFLATFSSLFCSVFPPYFKSTTDKWTVKWREVMKNWKGDFLALCLFYQFHFYSILFLFLFFL